ncbi:hypothetical protein [Tenacibaculum sp. 190524A02b]|uniref:hypothetical protein n=1 Tax=Tenacibaculum vairaonense TaxID=3137860 RepID=UPI0032B2BE64
MKIHISFKNKEVILYGFYEGWSPNSGINWKVIERGDTLIGTPWWEVMHSFSHIVDNPSGKCR